MTNLATLSDANKKSLHAGALHFFAFQKIWEAFYAEKPRQEHLYQEIEELFDGLRELLGTMGISLGEMKFPKKLDPDSPVTMATSWLMEESISESLKSTYGKQIAFSFNFAKAAHFLNFICNISSGFERIDSAPPKRRRHIEMQRQEAQDAINVMGEFLADNARPIKSCLGNKTSHISSSLEKIIATTKSEHNPERFRRIFSITNALINELFPEWGIINEDLIRARTLRAELRNMPIGEKHWRSYEELCIRILNYLFVPPFRKVYKQARTSDGRERRDAVLSNNLFGGFWGIVRTEFDARHVVCEFKNGADGQSKNALNQLRVYLSSRAIGRFGFLFVRHPPSKSLLLAQRAAYDQGILILILDDALVVRMLAARTFARSPDSILEDEKTRFELSY